LIDLAERHDAYYATQEDRPRDWISVRGIAVDKLARSLGKIALVHSPALPPELAR
jgi:hypothetical protein